MTPPVLKTDRLVLRPLRRADTNALTAVYADPETSRHLGDDLSQPDAVRSMVLRRLTPDQPEGMGHWVFELDGEVVGLGHLRPSVELPAGLPEIGWYLARTHWGRGLAGEAARGLLEHGLRGLGVPAVWALIHSGNTGSLKLAQRLGFLDVGTGEHYGATHRVHVALADRS